MSMTSPGAISRSRSSAAAMIAMELCERFVAVEAETAFDRILLSGHPGDQILKALCFEYRD